jgi:hypothetical protein
MALRTKEIFGLSACRVALFAATRACQHSGRAVRRQSSTCRGTGHPCPLFKRRTTPR